MPREYGTDIPYRFDGAWMNIDLGLAIGVLLEELVGKGVISEIERQNILDAALLELEKRRPSDGLGADIKAAAKLFLSRLKEPPGKENCPFYV